MVDQKMIAGIFTDFRDIYTGKAVAGIHALCEKYKNHRMLMTLLSNMDEAVKLDVPVAMKEIYSFYKEYRGQDLTDKDWSEIVEGVTRMAKDNGDNRWYRGVILEITSILESDDRERRRIAQEVEKEMEEAARAAEQEAA